MDKVIEVNESNFDQTVLQAKTPVLVDFWAPWCRPCLMVAPILDELAKEYNGRITIARMNVDQSPMIASRYGIMAIPTMFIFKEGKPVSNIVGFKPKPQLKQSLDAVLD